MGKNKGNEADGGTAVEPLSMADILGLKQQQTQAFTIWLDPSVRHRLEQAELARDRAQAAADRMPDNTVLAEAAAQAQHDLGAVEAAAGRARFEFVFRSIGRQAVEEMMANCRPTKEQVREFKADLARQGMPQQPLPYDPDTFPPRLLAASAVSPEMTEEQAIELWNSEQWSKGELAALLAAAWAINEVV